MSSPVGASSTGGSAEGVKGWWQTSSRKDKAWAIVVASAAGLFLLSLTDDGSDSDDFANAVEQQTMQSIAGVDTPGEACSAGYDWACDVTKTDYKPVSSVYVYTEIPAADIQGARVVAYAYYMSVPDLEEVVVINRGGGEFDGLTRQDMQDMPGL